MMKYRNHLDKTPNRHLHVAPRRAKLSPDPKDHGPRPQTDEPLIDVHDKPSRFEDVKELTSAITQSISTKISPILLRTHKTIKRAAILHAQQISRYYKEFKATKRLSRAALVTLSVYAIVFIGGYVGLQQLSPSNQSMSATLGDNGTQQRPATNEKPTFSTILPQGKSIDSLGGWARVSPPDRDPVFAFVDSLSEQQITISQQPLPVAASENAADKIKSIAYDFNAKERHTADDGTEFYVGTSSKGPQSVITGKNDLLILIKSPAAIEIEDWSTYIASLQ